MSNKMLGIFLLVIVIFLVGTVFLFTKQRSSVSPTQQTQTASPSPTFSQLRIVPITLVGSGFSPKIVTIKKGEGVIWTNKSGIKATINSADHPTHKKFPEVNLGEFANGESINQVFTKPGKYEYHNHYNPQESGTIIVE